MEMVKAENMDRVPTESSGSSAGEKSAWVGPNKGVITGLQTGTT